MESQLFELLTLIWESRNTHGLSMILCYGFPVLFILAGIMGLAERRYERQLTARAQGYNRRLHGVRSAVRDMHREIDAWELAAKDMNRRNR